MKKWHLKDWNLKRLNTFKGIQTLIETPDLPYDYYLSLTFDYKYRSFLIGDNGGELNFVEIGKDNPNLFYSMPLPVEGHSQKICVEVVYYRIMNFIQGKDIDYQYRCENFLTDEEWNSILIRGKN